MNQMPMFLTPDIEQNIRYITIAVNRM